MRGGLVSHLQLSRYWVRRRAPKSSLLPLLGDPGFAMPSWATVVCFYRERALTLSCASYSFLISTIS